MTDKNIQLYTN